MSTPPSRELSGGRRDRESEGWVAGAAGPSRRAHRYGYAGCGPTGAGSCRARRRDGDVAAGPSCRNLPPDLAAGPRRRTSPPEPAAGPRRRTSPPHLAAGRRGRQLRAEGRGRTRRLARRSLLSPTVGTADQATKYLAWGWLQMMASVVCSGWSWKPSLTVTPMRSPPRSSTTLALSSRSGQAG